MRSNVWLVLVIVFIVNFQGASVFAQSDHGEAKKRVENTRDIQPETKNRPPKDEPKKEPGESTAMEEHPDFGGIDVSPSKTQDQDLGAIFPVGISGRYLKMGFNLLDFFKPDGEKKEENTLLSFQYRPMSGGEPGTTCSGTVVDAPRASGGCKKVVITAAHCLADEKSCKESGEVTLEGSEWASKIGEAEKMKFKFKLHPKYLKESNSCKTVPQRGDTAILEVANQEDCKRLTKSIPVCTKEHLKQNKGEVFQSSGRKGKLVKYKPSNLGGKMGGISEEVFNMNAIAMPSTNKLLEHFPGLLNGSGVGDSGGGYFYRVAAGKYCLFGNVHGSKGDALTNVTPYQGVSAPLEWLLDSVGSSLQGGAGPGSGKPGPEKQPGPTQNPGDAKGKNDVAPPTKQDEPRKAPQYPEAKSDPDPAKSKAEGPVL